MNTPNFNGWQLLKLIYALRQVNIDITILQVQEALNAINKFPQIPMKKILQSLFINRQEDLELFHMVYDIIDISNSFPLDSGYSTSGECSGLNEQPCEGSSQQGVGTGRGGITLVLNNSGNSAPSQLTSFQMPDLKYLMELKGYPSAIDQLEDQDTDLEKKVKFILGQGGFLTWSNSIELARNRGNVSENQWEKYEAYKNFWNHQIRKVVWQDRLQNQNKWEALREVNWRYKPLNSFTAQEEGMVHQALRRIGNTLAVHRGLRKKKASRGQLRISSLNKELIRGKGNIFRFEYEAYALKHPELIVLCDVSNSVAPFSQFLLYLCQRIRSHFRKVRLFLFIDGLWEVTNEDWLRSEEPMIEIRSWGRKHSSGFSDYGKVFQDFAQNILPELSSRGTVIILGDGRSNYRSPRSEYLQEIQAGVKHIYWLNPLEEKDWSLADNLMKEYRLYCTQVFPCKTLNDLWLITKRIFVK